MTIEERLEEIDLSTVSARKDPVKGIPSLQMDNFAVLLVQGLESEDAEILNVSVLRHFPQKQCKRLIVCNYQNLNFILCSEKKVLLLLNTCNGTNQRFPLLPAESLAEQERCADQEDGSPVATPCSPAVSEPGESKTILFFNNPI